jgi:excisionase family DNA binding protein
MFVKHYLKCTRGALQGRKGNLGMSQMVSVEGAADMSGLSVSWWRKKVFRKEVPFYKVGRRVLLSAEDIQGMLQRSRVEPGREGVR